MKILLFFAAGLCIALTACNNYQEENADKVHSAADSTSAYSGSSSAAVENRSDTVHQFIRTADLKFRVGNVERTTYRIEDVIASHGGYVTLTQLNSNIDNSQTTVISEDSSLEVSAFTVINNMVIRVLNTMLDTTLKDIARLVDYLDYRIIKADDVSLQLYANNLQQVRMSHTSARLTNAIDKKGKKLSEISTAEEILQHKQAAADEASLTNRALNDQVHFSTVQLSLYQRQAIRRELIPNQKLVKAYEPGFGWKVLNALQVGLEMLEDLFITLLKFWPFWMFVSAGFLLYKKFSYIFKK